MSWVKVGNTAASTSVGPIGGRTFSMNYFGNIVVVGNPSINSNKGQVNVYFLMELVG